MSRSINTSQPSATERFRSHSQSAEPTKPNRTSNMVRLQLKRGNQNQFIYVAPHTATINQLSADITAIFNGRLKVGRIAAEMEELAKHGPMLPPDIVGLTDEQVTELRLVDAWAEKCTPQTGFQMNRDPIGRRNGRAPMPDMQRILTNAIAEAKQLISVKLVEADTDLTMRTVQTALDQLRGACTIVYPMQLPPHDPIRAELTNTEDLSGMQAQLEVMDPARAELWFAGKQMLGARQLGDYVGRNDRTRVIVKLQRVGEGAPAREPVMSEEQRKQLMLHEYRRQEELKRLELDEDDSYLGARWADGRAMQKQMHGLDNVRFRPGF